MRKILVLPALLLMLMAGVAMAQDAGERPFLGITFAAAEDGALVREVLAGSPAAAAGLQAGDLIRGLNGAEVTPQELAEMIGALAVGDEVALTIVRDGAEMALDVTLGKAPARVIRRQVFSDNAWLGLRLESDEAGVRVAEVLADSPAEAAGLQAGDLLRSVDGAAVSTAMEAAALIRAMAPGDTLTLGIEREGEALTLEAELGARRSGAPARGMAPLPQRFDFRAVASPMPLGVEYLNLDAELAAERGLTQEEGAFILRVQPDSPAEAAGLLAEDIIVAVEGDPVDARRTLRERLLAYDPGETLQLEVLRAGEALQLEVTLAEGAVMLPFGGPGGLPPGALLEALPEGMELNPETLQALMERLAEDFDLENWSGALELLRPQMEALAPAPDV